ncbi:MAG: radical SAM protein [Myxococcales bacterium]|nr:MAG: radical SAM protein [Myxococcales bacterium]
MPQAYLIHCPPELPRTHAALAVYGGFPLLAFAAALQTTLEVELLDATGAGKIALDLTQIRPSGWEGALTPALQMKTERPVLLHFGQAARLMPEILRKLAPLTARFKRSGRSVWLLDTPAVFSAVASYDPEGALAALPDAEGLISTARPEALAQALSGQAPEAAASVLNSKTAWIDSFLRHAPDDWLSEAMRRYALAAAAVWPERVGERRFPATSPPAETDDDVIQAHLARLARLGAAGVDLVSPVDENEIPSLRRLARFCKAAGLTLRLLAPLRPQIVAAGALDEIELLRGPVPLAVPDGLASPEAAETRTAAHETLNGAAARLAEAGLTAELHVALGGAGDTMAGMTATLRRLDEIVERFGAAVVGGWQGPPDASFAVGKGVSYPVAPDDAHAKALLFANYFGTRRQSTGEEKLIINVSYKCNNHCIFCSIADRKCEHGDFAAQTRAIDQARAAGVTLLDIDGGEPTLYPRLFDLLDHAVKAGMKRITITSNGRMLADPALVRKLAAYPIQLLVSLHAGEEAVHDGLTTQAGSFRQTVRGLMNALKAFPELGVNTTLVAANVAGLEKTAALVHRLGVKTWNLQYYTPFGEVKPELAPDPYEAGRAIAEVIDRYGDRLRIQVINLPFCFLPGHEAWALQDYNKSVRRMLFVSGEDVNLADYLGQKRFKNGKCDNCPFDPVCKGFWDFGRSPATGRASRIRLLDVIPGYPCSAQCVFCAVDDCLLAHALDTEAVIREIDRGMAYGPTAIRFGGGEPTERDDLPELVAFARRMGFPTISVQTHGFRLAEPAYLSELIEAGATKFNLSVRGADAATHEALTGAPGSFEKLVAAVRAVAALAPAVELELDAILTRQTVPDLAEQLRFWHKQGARRMNLWFVTAEGRAAARWADLVPNMTDAAREVALADDAARALGMEPLRCYYIPYCFFKGREAIVWHPLEENALVVTPGSRFTLDKGQLDLGVKADPCSRCAARDACFGIAPSYLQRFGDGELKPYAETPEWAKKE